MSNAVIDIKRKESKVWDNHAITPTLTISHVMGKFGTNLTVPCIESLTMVGVGVCPADLAEAFLTFVSQITVPYTEEELATVTSVITEIHQRYFKELDER